MMNTGDLHKLISRALREDAVNNDITTTALIPAGHISRGTIIVKEDAVICGLDIARKVFQRLDRHVRFRTPFSDGARVKSGTAVAALKGKTRALLTGERTALNFLGYLSGIATAARRFVREAAPYGTKIFDTRKTTPGMRALEKYAVRCAGGHNHRSDLGGLALIKDNHREACRPRLSIPQAVRCIQRRTRKPVEVEVDNLEQFKQALAAGPDIILLDNMSCARMKKAVAVVRKMPRAKRPLLEASGGMTLRKVAAAARTGVDRISVGSLTRSHKAIDVSLELI